MPIIYYYLLFYLTVFTYGFCWLYPEFTKPSGFVLLVFLVLFETFKNPLVNDGANYYLIFDQVTSFFDFIQLGKEPVFSVIPFILKFFGVFNVYSVFFIFALIGVLFKFKFFYKFSPLPILSIMLYFPYFYLKLDTSALRSGCAIAILMWSIQDIYSKNLKTYILKLILAAMFHVSILAALPFYLFKSDKVNYKYYMYLFLIILTLDVFHLNPISLILPNLDSVDRLSGYTSGVDSSGQFYPLSTMHIFWFLEVLFFFKNKDFLLAQNRYSLLVVKIFFVGIFYMYLIAPISVTFSMRLAELFLLFNCVVLCYYYYFIQKRPLNILVFSTFLIAYSFWWLQLSLSQSWLVDRHYY